MPRPAGSRHLTPHIEESDARMSSTPDEPGATNSLVTGNLELRGVTKSISFPATISVTDQAVTIQAEFAINRRDFNINYAGRANDLVRDNVVIQLDLQAAPKG